MKNTVAKKSSHLFFCVLLFLAMFFAIEVMPESVATVQAASYVKQSDTTVRISSGKPGWQKIKNDYYFYNSKGRLLCGSIKYKGYYYYSTSDGKRFTGWLKRSGNKYYYNRKNGAMFRNRWATGTKYKYYFNNAGVAIASQWLTYNGKKYYFLSNSTMATGWHKIGNQQYYFNEKTGQLVKSSSSKPIITKSADKYTYQSSTLKISLQRKSVHNISYWTAHIKTASPNQLKSSLSYGTYGGKRQTTSSAVSSNSGIIGVNGSAFDYDTGRPSPLGMCIKNGTIYGDYATSYSVMAVKKDGTLYTPAHGLYGRDLLAAGVKDTYNFGPVLINDRKAQLPWAETEKYYPRTAIGMVRPGDYVLLVTDTGNYTGLNHWDMVNIFQSYGCKYAYNLDGGGSSTLYFNGKVMNRLISDERPCGDFLYFTN